MSDKRYYTLSFLFILLTVHLFAQKKGNDKKGPQHLHVHVMSKAFEDSIVIRWAPENAVAWNLCRDSGYEVTRIDYSDPQHPVNLLLTAQAFKPMTLEQMKATLDRNDKYAAIAAQAMYGNDFRMTKEEPGSFAEKVKQGHNAMNFRFSFAMQAADFSAPVASALALRWVDKTVKKGGKYVYLITVRADGKNYVVDSAATLVINIKKVTNAVPEGLKAFGFDRRVELHWNRRQMGNFSAYYIERSDDEGKTFHTLNKLPFYAPDQTPAAGKNDTVQHKIALLLRDHQVYFDSIPQDYKTYFYRLRGINAFAELSSSSLAVEIQGRDLTAPVPPVIDSAKNISGNKIKISWTQRKASPDLAGYFISRSNSVKGPFYPLSKTMLDKNIKSFTDTAALPHLPNYYVVVAVDTARNLSASSAYAGYLTDTIPPKAPIRLAGNIDSNGVVHLHWAANKEPDLKGYKVYYAYNPQYEFSQLTEEPITDTSFTDTISTKSLNRNIYYELVAVDKSNNHSTYSSPTQLKKPVVVPPSAPVATHISVKKTRVDIDWIESRSEGAAGYEIYRMDPGHEWKTIAKLNQQWHASSVHFTDTTISPNTDYYYSAETIDGSSGLHSTRSFVVHARSKVSNTLPAPDDMKTVFDAKQNAIKLNWKYTDDGDYYFIVYRAFNNGPLTAWHSFDKKERSGTDNEIKKGTYQYAIKIVYRNKPVESALSKTTSVNTGL